MESGRMFDRRRFLASTAGAVGALALSQLPALADTATPVAAETPIVDVAWLSAHLGDPTLRIIALQDDQGFANSHLPGAVVVDWNKLNIASTTEASVETWRSAMAVLFTKLGVTTGSTVVAYDPGTFYAARIWWVLDQIGLADKRLLSGGLPGWTPADGQTETGAATPSPAVSRLPVTANDAGIARIDQVIAAVQDNSATFIDARTPQEYAAGHLPSAINIPMLANAVDGPIPYWKSPDALIKLYRDARIDPTARVIPYCSTGVRSANTFLALKAIGYPDVALFTGSWTEWSTHPNLPVTKGAQP
jgi:thiosulfate/3-mercaptopyruvate sulfurtransferase